MFRRILLMKVGSSLRFSSNNTSLQSVKWNSSAATPLNKINNTTGDVVKEDSLIETAPKIEHEWVKSKLEREINSASDVKTLLSILRQADFGPRNAVNVVNILGQWAQKGQLTVQDFQKLETRQKLEELLCRGDLGAGVLSIQEAINSLMLLGLDYNSKVMNSLENEIVWLLRKATIRQHFYVIGFHQEHTKLPMRQQVLLEAVQSIQRRWVELIEARDLSLLFKYASQFPASFIDKMEDVAVELVIGFNQYHRAQILTALASSKRRTVPLLRALSYHINKSAESLSILDCSNILFALNRLSFHDQALAERTCNDLVPLLNGTEIKPFTLNAIITSLGMLKHRHEGLLEALSDWMNNNWSQVQSQNVSAFLLTLATVDFVPSNWETLWSEKIQPLLMQSINEPKWNSSTALLDVAWSLAVLDQLDSNLAQSVLNDTYLLNITKSTNNSTVGDTLKVNQLWALATLKGWKMDGLSVQMPIKVNKKRNESPLNKSVLAALTQFVPGDKYLYPFGRHLKLGIEFEAECILTNDSLVPLALAGFEQSKPLPSNATRIALVVLDYKDLCLGKPNNAIGYQVLRERLLKLAGYNVLAVRHTEFNVKDQLVKQVLLVEQLLKKSLQPSTPSQLS